MKEVHRAGAQVAQDIRSRTQHVAGNALGTRVRVAVHGRLWARVSDHMREPLSRQVWSRVQTHVGAGVGWSG